MNMLQFRQTQQREKYAMVEASGNLEHRLDACLLVSPIAELLYRARCFWIGGGTVPWADLTPGQKDHFRREVEQLIVGARPVVDDGECVGEEP